MCRSLALTSVVLLTVITVTRSQYFDFVEGLQQLFQPFAQQDYFTQYNGVQRNPASHRQPNRQENKKKTNERRTQHEDRRVKKPPVNQYDYVFATTQKPSRKATKSSSSQTNNNSRNYNKNQYSNVVVGDFIIPTFEITTKANRNRVKTTTSTTTTEANYFNNNFYDINRGTTENLFSNINNNNRGNNYNVNVPVTENPFQNKNQRENYAIVNYDPYYNSRQPDNNNNGNTDYSNSFQRVPDRNYPQNVNNNQYNNRENTNIQQLNNQRVPNNRDPYNTFNNQNIRGNSNNNNNKNYGVTNAGLINTNKNNRVPNYGSNTGLSTAKPDYNRKPDKVTPNYNNFNTNAPIWSNSNDNNGGTSNNNNRRNPNQFNVNNWANTDLEPNAEYPNYYPTNNPLINRPGVKPAPVDIGQPPITNKPLTGDNNYFMFPRQTDSGSITFTDAPDTEPEILIGPDEDDMSEAQKRRYIDLAEKMCDRYKALNVKKVVALPLVPSPDPVELNVSSCTPITAPLVIGGKVVSIREFPHMALVGWMKTRNAGYSWKCGGSLISDRYILTAGHCTYQDKDYDAVSGPPQAVQLGSSYLDDPRALVVKVAAVIRHPKYKMRRSYHDIALIKMVSTVTFSEVVRPACLGVPPPVGQHIIATGWGRTEFGGDHSIELRSVSLPVWDLDECREIWGTSLKLPNGPTPDSHVCAGERSGGKDTCQGDSGGPAQLQDGCAWRVVAVTSFGRSCGAPGTPALYARIPRPFVAAQVFGEHTLL